MQGLLLARELLIKLRISSVSWIISCYLLFSLPVVTWHLWKMSEDRADDVDRDTCPGTLGLGGRWTKLYPQADSAAAFRPEIRPNTRHSPMLPVPW